MASVTATRRGLLGFLAAAPVALAAPAAPKLPQAQDWRTKPVEEWTRAEALAEAIHHVTVMRRDIAADPTSGSRFCLPWWERELTRLQREGR